VLTYGQAVALYGCPRALAIATGVDPSTVARWQQKKYIPRHHALALLLLNAPGAHQAEREMLVKRVMKRHAAALRYVRKRRPDLVSVVPFEKLAPMPGE
jgi:hypothetical protein